MENFTVMHMIEDLISRGVIKDLEAQQLPDCAEERPDLPEIEYQREHSTAAPHVTEAPQKPVQ